ncbi:hypothetical protein DFJ73DRAFT_559766 [Zopfochytrium polystomum]|nr:hypothetical protein DFJ73DRAFT_559766 [Zopfochytrium polystomum]
MIKSNAVRSAARSMKHIATRKWLFAVIIATATLLISPVLDDLKRVSVRIALHKKITVDPVATENDSDSSTNHDLTLLPLGLTRQILAERETIDKLLTRGMSDLPESIVDTRSYGAIFFCGSAATEAELWDCTYNVAASAIALRDTGFKHPVAMAPLLMDGAESTALWEDYLFHYNIAIIQAAPDELGGKSQPQANRSSSVLIAALEAAPFENVIALDAKTIALKDPSFLFDNAEFLNHGCIFWPGINAEYSSETNRIMEEILFNAVPKGQLSEKMPLRPEGETSSRDAPVFSTDVLVLNKRKTWRAIQLAKHFSVGAPFYNQKQKKKTTDSSRRGSFIVLGISRDKVSLFSI